MLPTHLPHPLSVERLTEQLVRERVLAFRARSHQGVARLVQGRSCDLDLLLADDAARAAAAAGVQRIGSSRAGELAQALGAYSAQLLPRAPAGALRLDDPLPCDQGVISVQRLSLPQGRRAAWLAERYLRWVPRLAGVGSHRDGDTWWMGRMLALERSPLSTADRVVLNVVGGRLAARPVPRGRLEFREVLGGRCVLLALLDYEPRLPWALYRASQAQVHVLAARLFGVSLRAMRGA